MHSEVFKKNVLISFFIDSNLLIKHKNFIVRNFMENSEIGIYIGIPLLNERFKFLKKYPL